MWIKKRVKKVAKVYRDQVRKVCGCKKVLFSISLDKVEFYFPGGYPIAIHKAMWRD